MISTAICGNFSHHLEEKLFGDLQRLDVLISNHGSGPWDVTQYGDFPYDIVLVHFGNFHVTIWRRHHNSNRSIYDDIGRNPPYHPGGKVLFLL